MATNEIYKHGQWLALPLPLRGDDPAQNDDPTLPGDPVVIGDLVGFAQEVGGRAVEYTVGSTTVTQSRNTANSLEPGWASVAMEGAFAFPVTNWDPITMGSGTPVGINAATAGVRATLVANAVGSHWFGVIVGQTKQPMTDGSGNPIGEDINVPIVKVVQTLSGDTNTVPDKSPAGS